MLADMRTYIQQRKRASLLDMAHHFHINPCVVQDMLQVWVRKGKIKPVVKPTGCGTTCHKCDMSLTQVYEWVEYSS